ncbi:MAG: FAD-dependent monooxygenase [Alphaproteobacteria bacterium]|nr:FAD-dependent monooxygenase [Alphaproteobacteria bacterium]
MRGRSQQPRAEIAGAGIAGLAAAIGLGLRGWRVRVHERSPALRGDGAGIYIWENGLRVLEALGALAQATADCHQGIARETRDDRNRVVARAQWTREPGKRVVSIVRKQLLEALAGRARAVGAEVIFGSEAVGATPEGEIRFADGSHARADLVVAADGVNSRIRDSLGLLRSRRQLADGAIRLLIDRLPEERESEAGSRYVEYWSGHRRILYTPCSSRHLYLALTTLDSDAEGKAIPLDKAAWKRSFPHLAALIDRIDDRGRWDRFEVVRLHRWSTGRVAVVGDAAHAQAPNLGQGGGCSLMNALALAVAVSGAESIEQGLSEWEMRERPLTEHTQRASSLYGKVTVLPPLLRSIVLDLAGRSRWVTAQRMRTAFHIPTGTRDAR